MMPHTKTILEMITSWLRLIPSLQRVESLTQKFNHVYTISKLCCKHTFQNLRIVSALITTEYIATIIAFHWYQLGFFVASKYLNMYKRSHRNSSHPNLGPKYTFQNLRIVLGLATTAYIAAVITFHRHLDLHQKVFRNDYFAASLNSFVTKDGSSFSANVESMEPRKLGAGGALPSWAVVTLCSMYHSNCPLLLEFQEYPFPLKQRHLQRRNNEWQKLKSDGLKDHDIHLVGYEYPVAVDHTTKQECIVSTQTLSIEDQLDRVLRHLVPLKDTHNMIAFSMTDAAYAKDMLHEVYEMNNDIVGFKGAFFLVAMDSVTAIMGCQAGYSVIAMPQNQDLKKQVQTTKVLISKLLVERGQSFVFYEMDVWFVRSPLPLLREHMNEYDFLCSTHQWNPEEFNIGFYAVLANQATINYFKDTLNIIENNPSVHDQRIMFVVAQDNTAVLENRALEDHVNCKWCCNHCSETISFPAIKAKNPIRVGRLDPHVAVAATTPILTESTVAVHVLADAPLKGPFGKKILAKEFGVWYGWGKTTSKAGYYHRENEYRRYLFLENAGTRGGQSFVQHVGYHKEPEFKQQIARLVTLAKMTNRILILPQVLGDFFAQPLWLYLDLESLEKIGVVYRETNFAYNKKSWYSPTEPFRSVAQMAIVESSHEIHILRTTAEANWSLKDASLDIISLSIFPTDDPLSAFFTVASKHPNLKESEALFVNLAYFHGGRSKTEEVQEIYSTLAWCEWGMSPGSSMNNVSATQIQSSSHCYGKGKKGSAKCMISFSC